MAEADAQSADQCKALTESGERCSRPARDDGFCYQHDESDPTVSDSQAVEEEGEQQADQAEPEQQAEGDETTHAAGSAEMTEAETDPQEVDASDVDTEREEIAGILSVRQTVQSSADELIGHPFDGVSEIAPTDDGWRAVVEVVERSSIPDTQDVIGRYELELDENAVVHGYRRLDRYRRGDTAAFE